MLKLVAIILLHYMHCTKFVNIIATTLRMHHFTVVLKHKGVDIPGFSLINNKLLSLKMHQNSRILKLELVIEIMNISDSCIKT